MNTQQPADKPVFIDLRTTPVQSDGSASRLPEYQDQLMHSGCETSQPPKGYLYENKD